MSRLEEEKARLDTILDIANKIWQLRREGHGVTSEEVKEVAIKLRDKEIIDTIKNFCAFYLNKDMDSYSVYKVTGLTKSLKDLVIENYRNLPDNYKDKVLMIRGIFKAIDDGKSEIYVQEDFLSEKYTRLVESLGDIVRESLGDEHEENIEVDEIESIFNDESFKEEPIHHVIYADVESGKKVYLKGLSGIGKTKLSTLIANKLGLPFYRMNISNSTMEADFLGEKVIDKGEVVFKYGMLPKAMGAFHEQIVYRAINKKGKELYKLTPFKDSELKSAKDNFDGIVSVRNITQENKVDEINTRLIAEVSRPGMLLIDEYDNGRQEYLFILQSVLEKGGLLTIKENFGEVIEPQENFRLMATGNTFGRGDDMNLYSRQELDVSQLDRFDSYYEFGYSIRERELFTKYLSENLTYEDLNKIEKLKDRIRRMIENGDLGLVFSTRRLISLCEKASVTGFKEAFLYGYYQLLTLEEKQSVKELYSDIFDDDIEENEVNKKTKKLKEYYEKASRLEQSHKK